MKIKTLDSEVIENDVFLWYNMVLGEYFIGNQNEINSTISKYRKEQINILYTMDIESYDICDKIKNSLNRARLLVG